jgi:hypothetical protein
VAVKSTDEILKLYRQRVQYYGPMHSKMRTIQSIYNNTAQIPMLDMERSESPSVPNLLAQGVDQMAGRIASVVPSVTFASQKPIRAEERRAQTAERVISGWWQQDRLMAKMKMRARHLIAYGMSPVVIRWDPRTDRPTWHIRHPLETFPSTDIIPGTVSPTDCIFAYRRSVGWLRSMGYSLQVATVTGKFDITDDASMLLLEYTDETGTRLILTSYGSTDPLSPSNTIDNNGGSMRGVILEDVPTKNGLTQALIPMRITLDGITGQFDNMIGMYYQQAKLMALEVMAVEKGIFPDTYIVSRPGEVGRFLDGPHDGRTGMVNIISGGDIREIQSQPGYLTNPTIDRLERAQRLTGGVPPEFGGESGSNIRTGRRGDAVLSAVIDYPVAEAQETFASSLVEEDRVAISLAKTYGGGKTRTIYVGTGNSSRAVTYIANKVFTEDEHVVSYPATGSDLNQLIIGIGQRVGLGIMSKETASQLDPYIDNPEMEKDRIIAEGLEQALMAGLQQQAAQGAIPPLVLAKIMRLVRTDKMELAEALNKVTEDAIAEQEAQQEQQMEEMGEDEMSPDEAMAGAALSSMAGPQAMPTVDEAPQGAQNFMQLLSTLRRPQTAGGGV